MSRVAPSLAVALAVVCCGGAGVSAQRPAWLSERFAARLVGIARSVRHQDRHAKVERTFVVRSTHRRVQRLGGWQGSQSNHAVLVVELWGRMKHCHSAPTNAGACAVTDGLTVVIDASTGATDDVIYGRLGAERLGPAYELHV
jgi:hypothetical protein